MTEKDLIKKALQSLSRTAAGSAAVRLVGKHSAAVGADTVRRVWSLPTHPDSRTPLQNRNGSMNR